MAIFFCMLLFFHMITLSMAIDLSEQPTLTDLCLKALKKLPPEQFESWLHMPFDLKQRFIVTHGLTYKPGIFTLAETHNDEYHYKISGVAKDNKLTLSNHFIDLSITKQEDSHKEGQLYSHQLFCPDCNCACLQEKNIYIGTESGHIHHYQVVGRIAKLIDVQRVSSSPIVHIAAHQIIDTLVSCQHLDGTIQIYQKNNNRSWKNKGGTTLNHPIKTMTFSLSGRWLAYADRYKAYVYDLANAHEIRTLLYNTHGIEALLFNLDQTLIISGRKGPLNLKQLFFWKFITDKKPSEHIIFPDTEKIILNHDNYYASDNAFTNRKWVDQVANQILFKLVLDNIHTTEEFDRFKKYKDTLHCGEQPLFKIIAILNKTHELQKAEKEASRLAYVRK